MTSRVSGRTAWKPLVAALGLALLSACGGGISISGSFGFGGSGAGPLPVSPAITAGPQAQTVVEGQSARFSASAVGGNDLALQWQRNGADIPGANSASYTTPALAPGDSGAQYSVRASSAGLSTTSVAATLQVLAEAATPAPQSLSVAPSTAGAGQSDAFGSHFAAVNPAVSPNGLLFVFFPGTGAVPDNYRLIVSAAANNGFAALGLAYPNDSTVTGACLGQANPDCTRLIRDETFSGNDVSPQVAVNPANSIRNRLVTALASLAQQQPQGGWSRFVDGSGNLRWSLIRVGGHSQGGGTAVHIGKTQALDRACFFAAPGDTTDGQLAVAPWVSAPGVTPAARMYGLAHQQDGIVPNALVLQEWAALQLDSFGPALNVDAAQPPYGGRHMLLTNLPRGNLLTPAGLAFHNLPVVDFFTPMDGGLPSLRRVWQSLCFVP